MIISDTNIDDPNPTIVARINKNIFNLHNAVSIADKAKTIEMTMANASKTKLGIRASNVWLVR
jgi:hypothetical protein